MQEWIKEYRKLKKATVVLMELLEAHTDYKDSDWVETILDLYYDIDAVLLSNGYQ